MNFFNNMKLKGKLTTLFILVGLLPVLILSSLLFNVADSNFNDNAFSLLKAMHNTKANQIRKYFDERMGDTKVISQSMDVIEAVNNLLRYREEMNIQPEDNFDVSGVNGNLTKSYPQIQNDIDKLLGKYVEV